MKWIDCPHIDQVERRVFRVVSLVPDAVSLRLCPCCWAIVAASSVEGLLSNSLANAQLMVSSQNVMEMEP